MLSLLPDARRAAIALAIAAFAVCAAAGPRAAAAQVAPRDSTRLAFEVGFGGDVSNFVFFEQSFDSTAFDERTTVSDPETRIGGILIGRAVGARGRLAWQASDELRAGDTLLRNFARAGAAYATGVTSQVSLDLEADLRRDTSFGLRRQDARFTGLAAGRLFTPDRAWSSRIFARAERVRGDEVSEALFPDSDWRQAGIDLDRLWNAGTLTLNYAYGARAFPDTAARDYREHDLGLSGLWRATNRLGFDLWGSGARRLALEDAAVGDRLWQADVEARGTWRGGESTEWGLRSRVRAVEYDEPTPTFFNGRFYRHAAFVRWGGAATTFEVRPEIEFARTPDFGGLPPTASDEDRQAVAGEEYDEVDLRLEVERFARTGWWSIVPTIGRRDYLDAATSAEDLSARSDFWFVELWAFADRRLGRGPVLRASADLRWEEHTVPSDDARSLSVAAEVRVPLR